MRYVNGANRSKFMPSDTPGLLLSEYALRSSCLKWPVHKLSFFIHILLYMKASFVTSRYILCAFTLWLGIVSSIRATEPGSSNLSEVMSGLEIRAFNAFRTSSMLLLDKSTSVLILLRSWHAAYFKRIFEMSFKPGSDLWAQVPARTDTWTFLGFELNWITSRSRCVLHLFIIR